MATEMKTAAIVSLKGANYATWKIQCRMALIREGLWGIVTGTETAPEEAEADRRSKFLARRDRALATIVLAVDPSLLYLIGDPEDPVVVWTKLQNQFQKKTWANKLALRRRLHSMQLKDGTPVQDHIKSMTELFNELAIVGDAIDEEDRVVYLLASLPDSFNTLVTALEANEDVPKMEIVTERLLHSERKQKDKNSVDFSEKAIAAKFKGRSLRCHYCKRVGHIQRNCLERAKDERKTEQDGSGNTRGRRREQKFKSHKDEALVTSHVLGVSKPAHHWIVDSGATCHICNSKEQFDDFCYVQKPQQVTLGDDRKLKVIGIGVVRLKLKLPGGNTKTGRLSDVLYVPELAYNLLSVPKVTEAGKEVVFDEMQCQISNDQGEVIAVASKTGSLYYLNCEPLSDNPQVNAATSTAKENLWHRRFGHLGEKNLRNLANDGLVIGFDYDVSKNIDFCEPCVSGKIHRSSFPRNGRERAKEPLGLIHSDVCGKINSRSLGGAEYFVTFIDDKTHYVWIYMLKHKHEVFKTFKQWKSSVENSSGHKVKIFRTDNGGEYMSTEFESYLKLHKYTIPKTPEQNGVSEKMNRTIVEAVRSMLADSKLPHRF